LTADSARRAAACARPSAPLPGPDAAPPAFGAIAPADTADLLGGQPPHVSSPAPAEMALAANPRWIRFSADDNWGRPTHPESRYCRGERLRHARAGIPSP